MKKRMKPADRRAQILDAALAVAREGSYVTMSRGEVAQGAAVSEGLLAHYFGTMPQLRRAVMCHAVATGDAAVIAQGLVARDPHAKKAPQELKEKAAEYLTAA